MDYKVNKLLTRQGYQYYINLINREQGGYLSRELAIEDLFSGNYLKDLTGNLESLAVNEMLEVGTEHVYSTLESYKPLKDYTDPVKTMDSYRELIGKDKGGLL